MKRIVAVKYSGVPLSESVFVTWHKSHFARKELTMVRRAGSTRMSGKLPQVDVTDGEAVKLTYSAISKMLSTISPRTATLRPVVLPSGICQEMTAVATLPGTTARASPVPTMSDVVVTDDTATSSVVMAADPAEMVVFVAREEGYE